MTARRPLATVIAAVAVMGACGNPFGAEPGRSPEVASPGGSAAASASPSEAACRLEIRAAEDRYIATGFPPDEQVTISFTRIDNGSRQTAADPLWRTDARGRLELYLAPHRGDVGRHRVEFEAGGCVATGDLEVPASRFPPECRHTPRSEASAAPSAPAASSRTADEAAEEIARDDPKAWWRLDEMASGTVRDEQGEHDGRHVGRVVAGVAGAHATGTAAGLADDAWIDVDDLPLVGDFTVQAWVRLCDVVDAGDALVGGDGEPPDLNFRDLRLRLWTGAIEVAITETTAAPETWIHWAVVRTGSTVEVWRNGLLDGTGEYDGLFTIAGLGRGTAGTLSAALDEVAVWERALPPDRLAAHAGLEAP